MSDLEAGLPEPFVEALGYLRSQRDSKARIDAIKDNFAYVWVDNIAKNDPSEVSGGWVRLPLAFPHANPHGFVTREALKRGLNGCRQVSVSRMTVGKKSVVTQALSPELPRRLPYSSASSSPRVPLFVPPCFDRANRVQDHEYLLRNPLITISPASIPNALPEK